MRKLGFLKGTSLILAVVVAEAMPAHSQTFTDLVSFDLTDGGTPTVLVQGTDGNIYGISQNGGSSTNCNVGCGTIFQVTPQGMLTTLHNFDSTDGASPTTLIQATDGNFYGTTSQGGASGCGTVFKLTSAGTLTTLYSFGSVPNCFSWLIQGTDGNFYGTTREQGPGGFGTVFTITPEGVLTTIHTFSVADGSYPNAGVIQATDGKFYGTTSSGGAYNGGTVFQITSAGKLTTLYSFCVKVYCPDGSGVEGLIQATDGFFYGTTSAGGAYQKGTMFKISSTGTLSTLYSFCAQARCRDGSNPQTLMQAADGNFYGTTHDGGPHQFGAVFNFDLLSAALTTEHSFDNTDGAYPIAGLIQTSDGTFYGTTSGGGSNLDGALFSIVMAPAVTFSPSSLSFGKVAFGEGTPFKTVWLRNSGTASLNLNYFAINGEDFQMSYNCDSVLAKGKSCTVLIAFAPTTVGKLTGSFVLTDNASNSPQTVALSGTSVEPAALTPATATFSARTVGTTSAPKTFTLTNNQTAGLGNIAISVSGDFAVSATTCATTLAAKSRCTISVTFTPTQTGTRTGQLSVSDDASNSPLTSSLTGAGR